MLSTTAKVVLALALISVALAIGLGFFGVLVSSHPTGNPTENATQKNDNYDEAADAARTSVPRSQWDKGMLRAVKRRCYIHGMSKAEVVRALGEPTKKSDYGEGMEGNWTWQLASGKCLRYDGDSCAQRETHERIIFFSPKGNVKLASNACYTLDDNYVMSADELFSAKPLPSEIAARAASHAKQDSLAEIDTEAASWHTQDYCEKNGYYWRDGDCHTSPQADPSQPVNESR